MQAFRAWAKGRNPSLAVFCHTFANMATYAYGLLKAVRDNEEGLAAAFPKPDLPSLLRLYRNHRKPIDLLINFAQGKDVFWNVDPQLFRDNSYLTKDVSAAEAIEFSPALFRQKDGDSLLENYLKDLSTPVERLTDPNEIEEYSSHFLTPEFFFFLRVFIPCWLLYGKFPSQLLRQARQGNITALDKLIRLDNAIIFDRKIPKSSTRLDSQPPANTKSSSPQLPASLNKN